MATDNAYRYNSAAFQVIGANEYNVLLVDENFLNGGRFDPSIRPLSELQRDRANLKRLSNRDCVQKYSGSLLTTRSNLLLVSAEINETNSLHARQSIEFGVGPQWMCAGKDHNAWKNGCTEYNAPQMVDNEKWLAFGERIQYCMSQVNKQRCALQYSQTIMVVVILCNSIKLACLFCTLMRCKERALCTLGDALDSFLTDPDPTTKEYPVLSKDDIRHEAWKSSSTALSSASLSPNFVICRKVYIPRQRRWLHAPSIARWLWCIFLFAVALGVVGHFFGLSVHRYDQSLFPQGHSLSALWALGFGKINPKLIIYLGDLTMSSSTWLIGMILLANLPQALLSFLYLIYNGTWTCMLAEREWCRFAFARKGLRVSRPRGEQRSSFYLQLPLRYALPLVATSSLLHWMVSQSLFFVRIMIYAPHGNLRPHRSSITSCGYSPIAIFFVIITGSVMLVGMLAMGFRKYPLGMPLAGSCSAVISAACHPDIRAKTISSHSSKTVNQKGIDNTRAHVEEKVMWGWIEGEDIPDRNLIHIQNHDDGNHSSTDHFSSSEEDVSGNDSSSIFSLNTEKEESATATTIDNKPIEKQPTIQPSPLVVSAKSGRFTFSTGSVEGFDPDPASGKVITTRSVEIRSRRVKMKDLDLDLELEGKGDSLV